MASLSPWRRRALAVVTAAAFLTPSTLAFAQPAADAAKVSLADGDKAAKTKDWKSAVASYDASNKAQPSESALFGLAEAYYNNGQLGEAYSAYTEWKDKYASKTTQVKQAGVDKKLKELSDKTGGVTITVSEAGATILVDDKQVGTSPLPGQLRLTMGPHHVKVTKDGFIAFDQSPAIAAATTTAVDVKLVAAGPTTAPVAAAPAFTAPVKVSTSDGKGMIYLDGQLAGEGSFSGQLAGGTHTIKITRDGYDTKEDTLVVADKNPISKQYTLNFAAIVQTHEVHEVERLEGVYGGFNLTGLLTPGGTGNDIELTCNGTHPASLKSCDAPGGLGAGLAGFVGYHWDPVGIELLVAGHYDVRTDTNDWNRAAETTGIGGDPARHEEFVVRRVGGLAALRVRLTHQWSKVRIMLPLGAGISLRSMSLHRTTTGLDGTTGAADGTKDEFVSDSATYVSPVIMVEPTVAYRITPGVSVTLGFQFFMENAGAFGDNPRTTAEGNHKLGGQGLRTPDYQLASNSQIYIGPTIGMMFGP